MINKIYADNAATTKLSKEALDAMMPYLTDCYGNPSSLYSLGVKSRQAVEQSRETIAHCIGADPKEIFFVSCGSEADNWAIRGAAQLGAQNGKRHIISSKIEHHAVLHTLKSLEKTGFEVTYLDVHEDGIVRPEELEAAFREDTALVTIMLANNEIGTIQPAAEIGKICKAHGVLFHTDAVQAIGSIPVDIGEIGCDMLSMSAHKFHGPKGVGVLYMRKGLRLQNLIDGGAQEGGRRAGTENVAGIVGMAAALEHSCKIMYERNARLTKMRDRLMDGLLQIERSRVNGDRTRRLPGNVNMCFECIEGEALLLSLDLKGIEASSGSACTSGSLDPSHVLLAIGLPHEIAHGSLRLSFSDENTEADIDYILEVMPEVVAKLRAMSPLYNA